MAVSDAEINERIQQRNSDPRVTREVEPRVVVADDAADKPVPPPPPPPPPAVNEVIDRLRKQEAARPDPPPPPPPVARPAAINPIRKAGAVQHQPRQQENAMRQGARGHNHGKGLQSRHMTDDDDESPRRREIMRQKRKELREMVDPVAAQEEGGVFSRWSMYVNRDRFTMAFAVLFLFNSIMTTTQCIYWLQGVATGESNNFGYALGFIAALVMTFGQFINSEDVGGENRHAYNWFLFPDVVFTAVWWSVFLFRIIAFVLLLGQRVPAESPADMARTLAFAWSHSWTIFLLLYIAGVAAVALSIALGVKSAKFPEQAFAGKPWSEDLRNEIRQALDME
jgi:hypothetical protein